MEVGQILHMNKGDGETSYAQNSKVQRKILAIAKPIVQEAIKEIVCSNIPTESMGIADLGCSSGPNTLLLISEIIDVIHAKCCSHSLKMSSSSVEFRVFLNDLFSTDFNTIFMSLPAFYNKLKEAKGPGFGSVFISAMPGSFYGRLFPTKSLHFVHSSCSLHWLSQVPPGLHSQAAGAALNKGKIYISKTTPQCVIDAYALQFHNDVSLFIKSRAEEIVGGGRMVSSLMGRPSSDPTTQASGYQYWELLAHAVMSMVSEGLIEVEKVDSFNVPYYAPCEEELNLEFQKEGSFIINSLDAFEIGWDCGSDHDNMHNTFDLVASGKRVAQTVRAVAESMLESHFGSDIMEDLFRRFAEVVSNHVSKSTTKYIILVISVTKKD